jgi:FMN-dependent NADH-azoreductase
MRLLLHVDSRVTGEASASRALTARVVEAERRRDPGLTVVYRDLAADPLGHLSPGEVAAGRGGKVDGQSEALRRDRQRAAEALDEFLAADVVVIGAPMYNFAVPTQLKAWLDRLCVSGKTFRYTEAGPRGLAGGRRVVIVSTRGGVYAPDSPGAAFDHQETYLRNVFAFLGVTDVHVVRAEGLGLSGRREPAMRAAGESIAALAAAAV